MRRISIQRPFAKVRGQARHFRALERWAAGFAGQAPRPEPDENFWHARIPVLDRLVDPPTASHGMQKRAIAALLQAASHLAAAASDAPYCRAAVLLTLPDLFQSEVTLFFDPEYYQGFYYQQDLLPVAQAPSRRFGLSLPPGFVELGNEVAWEAHSEEGENVWVEEQWWTIGQALNA